MSATLAIASPTTTQDRKVRNPARICADIEGCEETLAKCESPLLHEAIVAARRQGKFHEELVGAVMAENPALAEVARYKARIAETAHQAYLEGAISLEVRNRHASAAADKRLEILAIADRYLKNNGCGYISCGGVKELHHVA